MAVMSILDSVGKTPLIKIDGIWVKLEYLNPSGSIKDRIAKYIVERAEAAGQLKKGCTIVEATSGNTGIAFSFVAAVKGYKMIAVMPRGMSEERAEIMKAFGAKLIFVKDMKSAVNYAKKLAAKAGYYMPNQFENKWNTEEHQINLGREIVHGVKGRIDCFVAGVGTGGTLTGAGKTIRNRFPKSKLVAVEPEECALLSGKTVCKHHSIEGIGDGFIPGIVEKNRGMIDEVVTVSSKEAIKEMKLLGKRGYFAGPSSGANFIAAQKMKRKYRNVVTLFPDMGDRYMMELWK